MSGSELIISLTAIPPRFEVLGPALESLLVQNHKADRITVWIPTQYRRFTDWDGTMPRVPSGVEPCRTDRDLGPATKVLPIARELAGQNVDLLFCDDDRTYPPEWSATFLCARRNHPDAAICLRGLGAEAIAKTSPKRALQPRPVIRPKSEDWEFQRRRVGRILKTLVTFNYREPERRRFSSSGYSDMFEGCGGVLVRPDWFDKSDWDIPEFALGVDDIWLSGMLARKGIPIWLEANAMIPEDTKAWDYSPLAKDEVGGANRHDANLKTVLYLQDKYGVWLS